jgi:HlyD family secretion protein
MKKICLFFFLPFLLISCSRHPLVERQGYAEAELIYMASPITGKLDTLSTKRGSLVKAGETLFILDKEPQAAGFVQAKAQYQLTKLQYARDKKLYESHAIDQNTLDVAMNNLKQARASMSSAKWSSQQKTMVAPLDAQVYDTYFREGELVSQGQPVLALYTPNNLEVIFYITGTQLSSLSIGSVIHIDCDGCADELAATINYIAPTAEYTPPVIYSEKNNDKLVFEVRAFVSADAQKILHPGQPLLVKFFLENKLNV